MRSRTWSGCWQCGSKEHTRARCQVLHQTPAGAQCEQRSNAIARAVRFAQQNPWEDEHQRDEAQRAQAFSGWSSQVDVSSIEGQQQVLEAIFANSANVAKHSLLSEMVIDSGARKHMVAGKDSNIMQELLPASGTVAVADGHTTRPTAQGTVDSTSSGEIGRNRFG